MVAFMVHLWGKQFTVDVDFEYDKWQVLVCDPYGNAKKKYVELSM